MIEPSFLAELRHRHRAELCLVLVQLEQVCPGWWLTLSDLAEQLGTDRATLNRSLSHLNRLGLIRYASLSNCGGTWIWWVKCTHADSPASKAEPAWVIKDINSRYTTRIPVSSRAEWAARHGIPYPTLRGFLAGSQMTLRNRWRVISSPLDAIPCH